MKFIFTNIKTEGNRTYRLRVPTDSIPFGFLKDGRCGPGTGIWEKAIPEKILGISITLACKIHDYCYHILETEEEKVTSDLELFANAFRIIYQESRNMFMVVVRSAILWIYFVAVMTAGTDCARNLKED